MKPRLFIIAAIMLMACLVCAPVFASVVTATMGDTNSSGEYRVKADSDGVITFAADTGIKFPYEAGTTSDTLTAAETGKTIVSSAPTYPPTYTLPAAAVGMEFTFVGTTAVAILIDPDGTDTIKVGSAAAGQKIYNSSATVGDSITLFCATANEWAAKTKSGTWAEFSGY